MALDVAFVLERPPGRISLEYRAHPCFTNGVLHAMKFYMPSGIPSRMEIGTKKEAALGQAAALPFVRPDQNSGSINP